MPPKKKTTQEELKLEEELIKRDLAKVNFKEYCAQVHSVAEGGEYIHGRHLSYLYKELEDVERYISSGGKEGTQMLIVSMPPGHGKSSSCSIKFPTWLLGRNPDTRIVVGTYGFSLSIEHSIKAKKIMASDEFSNIFGQKSNLKRKAILDPNNSSNEKWGMLDASGLYIPVGVGGGITGKRGECIIIDDPHKSREEADSKVMRDKVYDWFLNDIMSRYMKNTAVIVLATRWHEDDLIGRIKAGNFEYKELLLPAICDDEDDAIGRKVGQALWPEMFDVPFLMQQKNTGDTRKWTSLYQQSPTADGGEKMKQEWFVYGAFPSREDILKGIQVWDTAFTEKKENDPSVCVTLFLLRNGSVFLAESFKERCTFPQLKLRVAQKYRQWNEIFPLTKVYIEAQGAGTSVLQSLKIENATIPIEACNTGSEYGKSKLARFESVLPFFESGQVILQQRASWLADFEAEMLAFPRGKHDDQVDAITYAIISVMHLMSRQTNPNRKLASDRWRAELGLEKKSVSRRILGGWMW